MSKLDTRLTRAEQAIDEAVAPSGVIVLRQDDDGRRYLFASDEGAPPLLPAELAELERNYSHIIVVRYVDMTATTTS